ncbi:MAG: RNA methyltransferase [Thermodesulfobacteriota bacterium]|nr:RNA methyltransferase [Thermodesulfobacteriota bacterium]
MNFANVVVVLVEPQGALNVGSVCRVMMNFGFSDLRMVSPCADYLSDDGRRMAVKARAVLEGAAIYDDLGAALADCCLAMGTTRRFGKYRREFFNPDQAARFLIPRLGKGRVALVFGREDSGLQTSDLDFCQRLITIPTSDSLPSMNLAQAVAICLYEIAVAERTAGDADDTKALAQGEEVERMFQHMRQTLLDIEFLDPQNPDHLLRTFRRIFGRDGLDEREVRILHGLWSRIDWLVSDHRRRICT